MIAMIIAMIRPMPYQRADSCALGGVPHFGHREALLRMRYE